MSNTNFYRYIRVRDLLEQAIDELNRIKETYSPDGSKEETWARIAELMGCIALEKEAVDQLQAECIERGE